MLLCTMLMAMGTMVFGASYANTREFFKNCRLTELYSYRSTGYEIGTSGTYPSHVGWTNVVSNGKFLNSVYQVKKLGIFTYDGIYSQKTGTITSTTTGQSFQNKLPNEKMKFEISGQSGVNATITRYVIYYN